ncbi:MAG TPA: cbb3-type cytochrome c oxidase N-terminal domain-containing protein [Bacteroidales bacterium]|jgi:cytochrome c oxidase cbb3-type subunit 3|nr:cbb3-type cytochrome c oxidase N-terminal domain-containing protein [Bacteroidales bacterium]
MGSDEINEKLKDKKDLHDEVMAGHDYDGIGELDNPPPRWIMALFYLTIGLSILYGAYYFWLGIGENQDEQYITKSAKHDEKYKQAGTPPAELKLLTDEGSLAEGKAIYTEMACQACHGLTGEGNAIGPNLTDEYWINGCSFTNVHDMIKNGNSIKGMTAFKDRLSEEKIAKVASYVLVSLKGSNPPNAKAAQGVACK